VREQWQDAAAEKNDRKRDRHQANRSEKIYPIISNDFIRWILHNDGG